MHLKKKTSIIKLLNPKNYNWNNYENIKIKSSELIVIKLCSHQHFLL